MHPSEQNITNLILELKKNLSKAKDLALSITQHYPNYQFGWKVLGVIYMEKGEYSKAIEVNEKSIKLSPQDGEAYYNFAISLSANGRFKDSIESYKKAIIYKPTFIESYNNLGLTLNKLEKYADAKKVLLIGISLSPNFASYNNLGNSHKELGENNEAIECYKKAILMNANYFEGYFNLGIIYSIIGDIKEATINFEKTIKLKPDYAEAYRLLSLLKKYTHEDNQIKELVNLYNNENLDDNKKTHLSFALAKVHEDLGDYEKAFNFYSEGNILRKKNLYYNSNNDIELFYNLKETYSIIKNINFNNITNYNKNLIFIVGMPRSGTTLIEQIISSHSCVFGAGELSHIENYSHKIATDKNYVKLENLKDVSNHYIDKISNLSTNLNMITDKNPSNFRYIGIIKTVFPNSKIIHVTRNPAAVCWSNFKNYFSTNYLGFCYDLEDISTYYKLYLDLMNFWKSEVVNHNIYDLDYDSLTINQEDEIKKLINYLQLDWEDNCLQPHLNRRPVDTVSKVQVRKKIYTDSSNDWLKFESYLRGKFDFFR